MPLYDVPTQLASFDLLKSEEMEGSTEEIKSFFQKRRIVRETYLLELESLKKKQDVIRDMYLLQYKYPRTNN